MSPDFVAVAEAATVTEALAAVRAADLSPQVLADVFVTDASGRRWVPSRWSA